MAGRNPSELATRRLRWQGKVHICHIVQDAIFQQPIQHSAQLGSRHTAPGFGQRHLQPRQRLRWYLHNQLTGLGQTGNTRQTLIDQYAAGAHQRIAQLHARVGGDVRWRQENDQTRHK